MTLLICAVIFLLLWGISLSSDVDQLKRRIDALENGTVRKQTHGLPPSSYY